MEQNRVSWGERSSRSSRLQKNYETYFIFCKMLSLSHDVSISNAKWMTETLLATYPELQILIPWILGSFLCPKVTSRSSQGHSYYQKVRVSSKYHQSKYEVCMSNTYKDKGVPVPFGTFWDRVSKYLLLGSTGFWWTQDTAVYISGWKEGAIGGSWISLVILMDLIFGFNKFFETNKIFFFFFCG